MASLFWRQFRALFWKNWIVLSQYPLLNLLRCFVLPIAYAIFLTAAQQFLVQRHNFGLGSPLPIRSLASTFNGLKLVWADGTENNSTYLAADAMMSHITRDFTAHQRRSIVRVASPDAIPAECPQNSNLVSDCFAAVVFYALPVAQEDPSPVNYSIRAESALRHIDVEGGRSDYEKRILPLQWAVDQAIIELRTGVRSPTPLEWPFSQATNKQQDESFRLSYIRGLRNLIVLAFFICFVGTAFQLPGAFASERANLLTSHLKAMGLMDSARILSWHVFYSLLYLPAWIISAIIWHYRIFTETHVVAIIFIHVLLGLSLASYSLFVAVPFGKSPQLAAIASTLVGILSSVLALTAPENTIATTLLTLALPPAFYVFAIRAVCQWEERETATNLWSSGPNEIMLLPLLIVALINIFLWPCLAILLERRLYDARDEGFSTDAGRGHAPSLVSTPYLPPEAAISVRNLTKTYAPPFLRRSRGPVHAVRGLSFDVPRGGIFVLLGANGAGKSTTLAMLGGLLGRTSGSITFADTAGGGGRPPPGHVGVVPQKNVMFGELTCLQNLVVWGAVKSLEFGKAGREELMRVLRECDLGTKAHAKAGTLSGGQKRKLQLAIGLVGGSKVVLVDECTSGVDPLSRRVLWRILTSVKHDRTIVFTTHFLDEADLLGDQVAILAAPGKLVASGTPVSLKSSLGQGYTIQVTFKSSSEVFQRMLSTELLQYLREIAPQSHMAGQPDGCVAYHLRSKDLQVVQGALQLLDREGDAFGVASYDVHNSSMEDIFLDLMNAEDEKNDSEKADPTKYALGGNTPYRADAYKDPFETTTSSNGSTPSLAGLNSLAGRYSLLSGRPTHLRVMDSSTSSLAPLDVPLTLSYEQHISPLALANSRLMSPFRQALTIFHKRMLITRRAWLTPLLAILVAVSGTTVPLVFIRDRDPGCVNRLRTPDPLPLYFPTSPIPLSLAGESGGQIYTTPPGVLRTLGPSMSNVSAKEVPDLAGLTIKIRTEYMWLNLGGVSVDLDAGHATFAWEATSPGLKGLVMLNLASNILYNRALNGTEISPSAPLLITPSFQSFRPAPVTTFDALKWVTFFGAAMSVYPAFFSLYVSRERRSGVLAMQLSNGLSNPAGLWLGHLLFDSISMIVASTLILILFAVASNQMHGLGLFWAVLVLYGFAATLFAYCMSLLVPSPLAAFAATAGYQATSFLLYLAAYLLVVSYALPSNIDRYITIIHFTISLISPVASVMRAAFVSVNLFGLLCNGEQAVTSASMGSIMRFGGPIAYLLPYSFVLFFLLVKHDSGTLFPRHLIKTSPAALAEKSALQPDVATETREVAESEDALRVLHASKAYDGQKAVDDVSFGVRTGTVMALLGPNGAGKTTTFNMIRGDVTPTSGQILINGTSVIAHPRAARIALGVCPQFTAIDAQLSVAEHLRVYGRLKGLRPGDELDTNVDALLRATGLEGYRDREASRLSGGNQRKLALAIALMGNPSIVLIDEFSSGVDAKMKRDMWGTLRSLVNEKAVVITTHSMEEASALSNKVGILARHMLAVGTPAELTTRHATYEVHFSCRTREEALHARALMARVPGARMADDVATRFEVPVSTSSMAGGTGVTLAQLFALLAEGGGTEFTVERPSLESVFLKVIRQHKVEEEDAAQRSDGSGRSWWRTLKRAV